MRTHADIWTLASELAFAYGPYYQPEMVASIRENGALGFWFPLTLARGAAPDPFTLDTFHALAPYTNPTRQQVVLDDAVEAGFMTELEGAYQLTAVAHHLLDQAYATAHARIERAPTLDEDEMQRISRAFGQILNATISAAEPADKRSLFASRWTDAGPTAVPAVQLDQTITDLLRFRDDAHLAAWRPTGVDGRTWEAFTFIWRGDADTAAALAEKLAQRQYTATDYADALRLLEQKGWVIDAGGTYRLTEQGTAVRENAETETDRLFFIGWSEIDESDLQELGNLLAELKAAVEAAAPALEPAAD